MKVTITNDEVKFLANLITLSEQTPDITVDDLGANWANWVAAPITHHKTKPREARRILIAVGILIDHGVPASTIIEKILECFVENYSELSDRGNHE